MPSQPNNNSDEAFRRLLEARSEAEIEDALRRYLAHERAATTLSQATARTALKSADPLLPEDFGQAERLAASVEQAVWRATSGKVKDLRVKVSREGVLLTGRCSTYYAKQAAQHAAMRVPGCSPLINQIEVV